jgi:hypothetical protein
LVFSPQDGAGVVWHSHPFFYLNIIALLAKDCQEVKAINIFLVYGIKLNMYGRINAPKSSKYNLSFVPISSSIVSGTKSVMDISKYLLFCLH